jgi:hypothetical protein
MALTKRRLMTVPQGETKPTGPDFYAPPGRKDVTSAAPPSDGPDDAAVRRSTPRRAGMALTKSRLMTVPQGET